MEAAEAHCNHPAEEGGLTAAGHSLVGVVAHSLAAILDYSLASKAAVHNPAVGFVVHTAGGAAVRIAEVVAVRIAEVVAVHTAGAVAVHIAARTAVRNPAVVHTHAAGAGGHILVGAAAGQSTVADYEFEVHRMDQAVEPRTVRLVGRHICCFGVGIHFHPWSRRMGRWHPTAS